MLILKDLSLDTLPSLLKLEFVLFRNKKKNVKPQLSCSVALKEAFEIVANNLTSLAFLDKSANSPERVELSIGPIAAFVTVNESQQIIFH